MYFPFPFDRLNYEVYAPDYLQASPGRGLAICLDALNEAFRIYSVLGKSGYKEEQFLHLYNARTTKRKEGGDYELGSLGNLAQLELIGRQTRDKDLSNELLLDILEKYCLEPDPEAYLPFLWHETARLFAKEVGLLPTYINQNWTNQPGSLAAKRVLALAEKYWMDVPRYQFGQLRSIATHVGSSDAVDFLERVFYSNARPDMDEPDVYGETLRFDVWAARHGLSQRGWVKAPNPLPKPKRFPPVED